MLSKLMMIVWFLYSPVLLQKYLANPDAKLYKGMIKQPNHPEESIMDHIKDQNFIIFA